MMKLAKRLLCAALAAASLLCPAFAADAEKPAAFWDNQVLVDGHYAYCQNEAGRQTFYLSYGSLVYVPLRTAAEWMGKEVTRNGNTFTLSGNGEPVYHDETSDIFEDPAIKVYTDITWAEYLERRNAPVTVTEIKNAKLIVDGTPTAITDIGGKTAVMIAWKDDPYLPISTAVKLLGMKMNHVKATTTISRTSPPPETIYIRNPITATQIKECNDYINLLDQAGEKFEATRRGIEQPLYRNLFTIENAGKSIDICQECARAFLDTPRPECHLLDSWYAKMQAQAEQALEGCEKARQLLQNNASLADIQNVMRLTGDPVLYPDGEKGVIGMCAELTGVLYDMYAVINEPPNTNAFHGNKP